MFSFLNRTLSIFRVKGSKGLPSAVDSCKPSYCNLEVKILHNLTIRDSSNMFYTKPAQFVKRSLFPLVQITSR